MKISKNYLKRLIKEELSKVLGEAISIPGYSEQSGIQQAIEAVATELGHGEIAAELGKRAAEEITSGAVSGYSINTRKSPNPANNQQPGNPQEEAFLIIAKIAMELGVEETQATAIGNKASMAVIQAQHKASGSKGIYIGKPLS